MADGFYHDGHQVAGALDEHTPLVQNFFPLRQRQAGLGWVLTAMFIFGGMAGSGILVLPRAVMNSSWIGPSFLLMVCLASAYTGCQLGNCWSMLQEQWPEFQKCCRRPYQTIADRAAGRWAVYLVVFCLNVTLIGLCVTLLIFTAQDTHELLLSWLTKDIRLCSWYLIVVVVLWPFTLLGTPKNFWLLAVLAAVTTLAAACFIVFGASVDIWTQLQPMLKSASLPSSLFLGSEVSPVSVSILHHRISFMSVFHSFGTIVFAFGGHVIFPTLQQDMRQPSKVWRSILLAFIGVALVYVPTTALSCVAYGDNLKQSVLHNIETIWVARTVKLLLVAHQMAVFVILINPVNQQFDALFNIPDTFCSKRVLLRTAVMLVLAFVVETIPSMHQVLALIGGSSIALLTYVFPGCFYLSLYRRLKGQTLPRHDLLLTVLIVTIALLGAVASTYSAVRMLIEYGSFEPPCYVPSQKSKINWF